ncbi:MULTISPECIES: spore coat protein CotJB [Cohnella]|uniref:spore coat protein CotJB n=1 Tax=Cohnella TaxID=329857 RepID=UPI0009BB4EA8|nr:MULTISPECIES: spore coat protein CotJB [Cohnella]MBN2984938.1 spore coat protein CotJB [Cohnella algarum]
MPEEKAETRPARGDEQYRKELEELQKVDFALVELSLYLDTHPADMQAIQQFNQLAQRRSQIAHAFELKYGPLMQFGHSFTRYPWQWNDTPWPWQV